jgi:hypothetical protein
MTAETPNSTPAAVMMSITEIAARDGVSKPTVSVKVKQSDRGARPEVERDGRGASRASMPRSMITCARNSEMRSARRRRGHRRPMMSAADCRPAPAPARRQAIAA